MTDQPGVVVAVVDDDRRILESIENLLESADYAVRAFGCAEALLDSGCLDEIGCLISDIDLPVINGFELLRAVRGARPDLPIIVITGHPDLLNRWPATAAGNCRLFTKPFDGQALLAAVGDFVGSG